MSDRFEGEGLGIDDYPHIHYVKAIGCGEHFPEQVREAVMPLAPGLTEAAFTCRTSRHGQYLAVTCTLMAESRSQLEAVYGAIRALEGVRVML